MRLVFLSILLEGVNLVIEQPKDKLTQLYSSILAMGKRIIITKRELQSLIDKLSWATQCVYGGRPPLRCPIDRLSGLHRPWHKSRITSEMRADLAWWCNFMEVLNGTTPMIDNRPDITIKTHIL